MEHPFLFWIFAGGIAGWLASLVAGTGRKMGCLLNIAVGVVGAVIGGWIFRQLRISPPGGTLLSSIVVAFVGAVVFLLVLKALVRE